MLARTDQPNARWHVVPAEQKRYGRVAVLRAVIERVEEGMRRVGIEPPPSTGADYGIPPWTKARGVERAR